MVASRPRRLPGRGPEGRATPPFNVAFRALIVPPPPCYGGAVPEATEGPDEVAVPGDGPVHRGPRAVGGFPQLPGVPEQARPRAAGSRPLPGPRRGALVPRHRV